MFCSSAGHASTHVVVECLVLMSTFQRAWARGQVLRCGHDEHVWFKPIFKATAQTVGYELWWLRRAGRSACAQPVRGFLVSCSGRAMAPSPERQAKRRSLYVQNECAHS